MDSQKYIAHITKCLQDAVLASRSFKEGLVADYIPELANVDPDYVAASVMLADGGLITAGDSPDYMFTMQSVSKLVLLIGLIEEFGANRVFSWINAEPSGQPFAAVGHLEQFGPVPSNPLINAGAIALSGRIPGESIEQQLAWCDKWMTHLFGRQLTVNEAVFHSELNSADRNRSLAYLMKSTGVLERNVEDTLIPYFKLCSYQVSIKEAAYLPMLLANGGVTSTCSRIISEKTSNAVVAIMATCGLYNESGMYLVNTGMPAKSGVSGLIIAVATGRGGVAVFSPRLNKKGGSIRGHHMLRTIADKLDWHFAAPWGFVCTDNNLHPQLDF